MRSLPNAMDPFVIRSKDQEVTLEWNVKIPIKNAPNLKVGCQGIPTPGFNYVIEPPES